MRYLSIGYVKRKGSNTNHYVNKVIREESADVDQAIRDLIKQNNLKKEYIRNVGIYTCWENAGMISVSLSEGGVSINAEQFNEIMKGA